MPSYLWSQSDNLAEGLHKGKCKDCKSRLEYMTAKGSLLKYKYWKYEKKSEDLSKRFENTYESSGGDINKFCLLLWKGVYPYRWQGKIQGNITHKEGILQQPGNGEHHRCSLQICLESLARLQILEFRPISWPVCTEWYPVTCGHIRKFQKEVCRCLWTWSCSCPVSIWIGMAGIFEENRIWFEITNRCWYVTNGWKRHQGLNWFWWKDKSKFTQKFIQNNDDDSGKGFFCEIDISFPKHLQKMHSDLPIFPFFLKEWRLANVRKLSVICMIKIICCTHKSLKASLGM